MARARHISLEPRHHLGSTVVLNCQVSLTLVSDVNPLETRDSAMIVGSSKISNSRSTGLQGPGCVVDRVVDMWRAKNCMDDGTE